MPKLNSYDVEIILVQKNIRAESAQDALATMESNIQTKGFVKAKETNIKRTDV